MKISQTTALLAVFTTLSTIASSPAKAETTSPALPVGWLKASTAIARAGTSPNLEWSISYPSTVIDYVDVIDPATVVPKQALNVEIRVLGAGVTAGGSNSSSFTFVPTEAQFSYAGGSYQRIFFGTNNEVNPTQVVWSGTVQSGEKLCFGGRYYYNRSWGPYYNSDSGTNNVRTLVNGQVPPTGYALHTAPTLENFIKPYLDASGRVSIGPMDVIVFMELTHTDAQSKALGYDLQDMVLLVTFKK